MIGFDGLAQNNYVVVVWGQGSFWIAKGVFFVDSTFVAKPPPHILGQTIKICHFVFKNREFCRSNKSQLQEHEMTGFAGLTQNMWRRFGDKAPFWIAEGVFFRVPEVIIKETAADTLSVRYGFEIN